MMRGLRWRVCVLGVGLSLLVVLAGCGGGGGGQPAPPTVTVTITSPTSAQTLQVNQTLAITASVSGTSNTAVTWKVNGVAGGNTTFGTISGTGLSVTYTAPASVPSPAAFNITVTSQADTSKSASLQVTIESPVSVSITNPTSAQTLQVNQTLAITASVSGTSNTAVTWKVNGVAGGNTTFGTISGTGLSVTYTAPASVPSPAAFNITVTSQADNTKSASIQVTITPATSTVSISITTPPSSTVNVQLGATQAFVVSVLGTSNTAVTWTVSGVTSGNSTVGTITGTYPNFTYHAPSAIPPGNPVAVIATSQADNTKSASVAITLTPVAGQATSVIAEGNSTHTAGINFNLSSLTPTLALTDLGTCTGTPASPGTCAAGATGFQVKQGATLTVWLLGQGLTNGTGSSLAPGLTVSVSRGSTSDVTVSSVTAQCNSTGNPGVCPSSPALTNITFQIQVGATATLGQRNIMVTNSAGELQAYVGGIQIIAGP
jgi:hypothetical protein